MANTLAVILGGGQGARLYPLTKMRCKPAVPLGGSYRLIDVPVSNCINSKIHRIFVLTQFNSASLNRHIAHSYSFDIFHEGFVEVLAAEQTASNYGWFQGTADAVRQNIWHFMEYSFDYYLILAGDHLYRMDYRQFIKFHQRQKADITIAVNPVSEKDASEYGILRIDESNRIIEFVEKPKDKKELEQLRIPRPRSSGRRTQRAKEFLASMGIYVFNRDALQHILETNEKSDFGRDIIPDALQNFRVMAYPFHGYWRDIGTIQAFYEANLELARHNPAFTFHLGENPIYTHPRFLPGSHFNNCSIKNSLVAHGCEINEASINQCIIGIRSVIDKKCSLEGVVMMGADYRECAHERKKNRHDKIPNVGISVGSTIRNAIIDKNARIGSGVSITNIQNRDSGDGEGFAIRDGIVVIEKDAIIPNGTII